MQEFREKYRGARLWMALNVRNRTLNLIDASGRVLVQLKFMDGLDRKSKGKGVRELR